MKQKREIRVIGNSRSGTTWLTRVLNAVGKDVGHEYVRSHGTVSCFFFMDTVQYPYSPSTHPKGLIAHVGERLSQYRFENTGMIVRHPLLTIGSIWSTMGVEHQLWLEKYGVIPMGLKPKLLKSMHTWHAVNLACEKVTDRRYQLERLAEEGQHGREWKRFANDFNLGDVPMPDIPRTNKSRGIFLARVVDWPMLAKLDPTLTKLIAKMGKGYGYKDIA